MDKTISKTTIPVNLRPIIHIAGNGAGLFLAQITAFSYATALLFWTGLREKVWVNINLYDNYDKFISAILASLPPFTLIVAVCFATCFLVRLYDRGNLHLRSFSYLTKNGDSVSLAAPLLGYIVGSVLAYVAISSFFLHL